MGIVLGDLKPGRTERVLVTGATGVFGQAAIKALVRTGYDVVGLARSAGGPAPLGVTWAAGDIRDRDAVQRAMEGCDAVVHLAWVVVPLRSADEIHDINLGGTQAGARRHGGHRLRSPRVLVTGGLAGLPLGSVPRRPPPGRHRLTSRRPSSSWRSTSTAPQHL